MHSTEAELRVRAAGRAFEEACVVFDPDSHMRLKEWQTALCNWTALSCGRSTDFDAFASLAYAADKLQPRSTQGREVHITGGVHSEKAIIGCRLARYPTQRLVDKCGRGLRGATD